MSNTKYRFYAVIPGSDGTATLVGFNNSQYDPRVSIFDQLGNAFLVDKMPLDECLEMGASMVIGGTEAAKRYKETVRTAKVRQVAQDMVYEPADATELAKLAAFLEGSVLDPSASPVQTAQALQHAEREAPEAQGEAPAAQE